MPYMVLTYLSDKYGEKEPDESKLQDAALFKVLKSNKPDAVYALIGDLRHHFPFLRYQDVLNEKNKGVVSEDAVSSLALLMKGGTVKQAALSNLPNGNAKTMRLCCAVCWA